VLGWSVVVVGAEVTGGPGGAVVGAAVDGASTDGDRPCCVVAGPSHDPERVVFGAGSSGRGEDTEVGSAPASRKPPNCCTMWIPDRSSMLGDPDESRSPEGVTSVASTSAAVDRCVHQFTPTSTTARTAATTARPVVPAIKRPTSTLSRNLWRGLGTCFEAIWLASSLARSSGVSRFRLCGWGNGWVLLSRPVPAESYGRRNLMSTIEQGQIDGPVKMAHYPPFNTLRN